MSNGFLLVRFFLVYLIVHGEKILLRIKLIIQVSESLYRLCLCTNLYTALKNSVASTHAIRGFVSILCTSLYTAKKLMRISLIIRVSVSLCRLLLE